MAFCTECGSKLSASDRFCSNCGLKVEVPEVSSVPSERRRVDTRASQPNTTRNVSAQSTARIVPIYGNGYKEGIHCNNCGAKRGNSPVCSVCHIDSRE